MFRYLHKIALLLLALAPAMLAASEFRRFEPIVVAPRQQEGALEVERQPVPEELVREGVMAIVAAWNGPDFGDYVSERAYDKSRLVDSLALHAPRDASLRLLSMQNMQTLAQFERTGDDGVELVSEVSVELVTQVEYEDPVSGFQRRNGNVELVLEVTQPLIEALWEE
ncbi:MAG: hypothetical protein O2780_15055 [Proteobacteria bacterium]|jgi:hypothetical protein|nr:hypothetical protein [Pseudomonadota bacterium]MDA1302595.1 hypothetical protein [Pseudomonadota bacterium]